MDINTSTQRLALMASINGEVVVINTFDNVDEATSRANQLIRDRIYGGAFVDVGAVWISNGIDGAIIKEF